MSAKYRERELRLCKCVDLVKFDTNYEPFSGYWDHQNVRYLLLVIIDCVFPYRPTGTKKKTNRNTVLREPNDSINYNGNDGQTSRKSPSDMLEELDITSRE